MKRAQEIGLHATRRAAEHSNDRHPGLCLGREWPCHYTTDQRDEIASFHYDPQTGSRHRTRPNRNPGRVKMSALGQKQTFAVQKGMSALAPKADIGLAIASNWLRLQVPKLPLALHHCVKLGLHLPHFRKYHLASATPAASTASRLSGFGSRVPSWLSASSRRRNSALRSSSGFSSMDAAPVAPVVQPFAYRCATAPSAAILSPTTFANVSPFPRRQPCSDRALTCAKFVVLIVSVVGAGIELDRGPISYARQR